MLTYNREKLVKRAVESVLAQTFRDFELIIVDNGSVDRSGDIADEFAASDERVSVIHRERANIGAGRNTGLDAARSEYIAFIDDDDWLETDYLEFLYTLARDNAADIAICGAEGTDSERVYYVGIPEKVVLSPEDAIIELLWRKRFNNGFPTKLIASHIFEGLRFPETGRYDDVHLMYLALAGANRVVSYGLPKYHILRHGSNNSGATSKDGLITAAYIDDYRRVYNKREVWLSTRFPSKAALWKYFNLSFQISMVSKIITNNLSDCETHLAEMLSCLRENLDEFCGCPWILEFEKEWAEKYVKSNIRVNR
jgi:glycosyltransferase involved in cell wall biosynthesis